MLVGETTVKGADTLPTSTRPLFVKLVPVMVTTVFTGPLVGVKPVMVGGPGAVQGGGGGAGGGGGMTEVVELPTTPARDAWMVTSSGWAPDTAVVSKTAADGPDGVVTVGGTARACGLELVNVTTVGVVGSVGLVTPKFTCTRTVCPPNTEVGRSSSPPPTKTPRVDEATT